MSVVEKVNTRAESTCELCKATNGLTLHTVLPATNETVDDCILICETCSNQLTETAAVDANHWRCLNDSIWSEVDAVKVVAWRMLNRLRHEGWPQDLLDMMYMDDETKKWAAATGEGESKANAIIHKDANGAVLANGDNVVLTKDLNVKGGGSLTAKRGTAVRKITLVHDNAEQIEGKVDGQQIVILTQYVKKT